MSLLWTEPGSLFQQARLLKCQDLCYVVYIYLCSQVDKYRGYYNLREKVDVSIGLWRVCEGTDYWDITDCTAIPDDSPCEFLMLLLLVVLFLLLLIMMLISSCCIVYSWQSNTILLIVIEVNRFSSSGIIYFSPKGHNESVSLYNRWANGLLTPPFGSRRCPYI